MVTLFQKNKFNISFTDDAATFQSGKAKRRAMSLLNAKCVRFLMLAAVVFFAWSNTALGGIYIVCDDDGNNPVMTKESAAILFTDANKYLAQGGIHVPVTVDHIQHINRSAWKNLNSTNTTFRQTLRQMGETPRAGDLRIFFIESYNGSNRTGFNGDYCMAIAKNASAVTLAHEIGHACGLRDIYSYVRNNTNQITHHIFNAGVVKAEYMDPLDWGAGYYAADLQQTNLITRLLMYGYIHPNANHIPHGNVYGVYRPKINGVIQPPTIGLAPVGLKDFNRQPQHRDYE